MSTAELKEEIHRAIEDVPENVLSEILTFVKKKQSQSSNDKDFDEIFERIIKEDKEVLQRLAK